MQIFHGTFKLCAWKSCKNTCIKGPLTLDSHSNQMRSHPPMVGGMERSAHVCLKDGTYALYGTFVTLCCIHWGLLARGR